MACRAKALHKSASWLRQLIAYLQGQACPKDTFLTLRHGLHMIDLLHDLYHVIEIMLFGSAHDRAAIH
eukprot:scaffold111771_cov15-Tisochrysis_lutea.AAC.1